VKRFERLVSVIIAFFVVETGVAAASPALQMHRAVYDLSLGHTQPVSDVTGIEGRMVVEWRGGPACGGYTSLQRVVTKVSVADQGFVSNDVRLSYWEAADGSEFRFTRTEYTNGELTDSEEGTATREKSGDIKLLREGDEPMAMPRETLFPMEYNLGLIEKAQAGHKVFSHPLFDGTEKGENPTTAFIGKTVPVQGLDAKVDGKGAALAEMEPWPVRISYFDPADGEGVPSFEMGYLLFPNGISAMLSLDYLDVEVKGALSEVTYFDPDKC
jgi:hypothetical protein